MMTANGCVYRKLNPNVLMMKSAQDGVRIYGAGSLNRTRDRRILLQRPMRSNAVVQHDDGTPTGSRRTSFFIRGILGPDAWSIFMRWLRRLAERFSGAASLVGHPGDGWRFRPGCSIGRPVRPGVLAPHPMLTLRCSAPWQRCCRM
jgi:hypothetical protein